MATTFDEETRALLDGRNFPVVATVSPDGAPNSSVVWAAREGDTVLFVTARHKPKGRNLASNPNISLSLYDHDNPYRAVEIRGTAEFLDTDPQELLDELGMKYTGQRYPAGDDGTGHVAIRITPRKVIHFNG